MRPCHFFSTPVGCRNGDRCRFLHTASPLPIYQSLCRNFNTNGCRFGARCRFSHAPPTVTSTTGLPEGATWSPHSKGVEEHHDGSVKAVPEFSQGPWTSQGWSVAVLELPNCSDVTVNLEITNGVCNQVVMVAPNDDFYNQHSPVCGTETRSSAWGVSDQDIVTRMDGAITIELSRRADSETTCTILCVTSTGVKQVSIVTSVLRGFPRDYLLAFGLFRGNIVRVFSVDSTHWLRRRKYLMVLLLSLGGRATGGTSGTAVLLARLAHLPWDVVEHVFQWL